MTGTSVTSQYLQETCKGVLRFDLNTCTVLDDVTFHSRLFHVFAVATGEARSPIVDPCWCTASAEVTSR